LPPEENKKGEILGKKEKKESNWVGIIVPLTRSDSYRGKTKPINREFYFYFFSRKLTLTSL